MNTLPGRRAILAVLSVLGVTPLLGKVSGAGAIEVSDVAVFYAAHVIDELLPGVELSIQHEATGCYLHYDGLPVGRLEDAIVNTANVTAARIVRVAADPHGRTQLFVTIA